MASLVKRFWEGVMKETLVIAAEFARHLASLPSPAHVKQAVCGGGKRSPTRHGD